MRTVTILRAFSAYEGGAKVDHHAGDELSVDDGTADDWKSKGLAAIKPKPKTSFLSTSDET